MKTLIIVVLSVVVLLALVFVWGATLPTTKSVSKTIQINAPVEIVWETMSDWKGQEKWRSDVKSVEILDERSFKEIPTNGPAVEFEIVRLETNKIIELKMSGPFKGHYLAEFSDNNGATTINISETIIQESIIGRILSRLFFDLEEFVAAYFGQLKLEVER
ncbi:SRPBCC family protein [Ningiella sp. W23]|uniref:SRPBCC family protein n=1 Tax=Ningiella sp. W23 TaxID=3023715 RepID=UPI0037574654